MVANFSPAYSKGTTPSPLSSLHSSLEESYSPPYSAHHHHHTFSGAGSVEATPLCFGDHMTSETTTPHLQPLGGGGELHYVDCQAPPTATPTCGGGGDPFANQMFADNMGAGAGTLPNQSIQLHTTFIPNANSSSNLTGYSESVSLPPLLPGGGPPAEEPMPLPGVIGNGNNMAEIFGAGFAPEATTPHVWQLHTAAGRNVTNARQRYSGATPISGHTHQNHDAVATTKVGVSAGRVTSSGGRRGPDGVECDASNSISQWSQWLKGGAPAPVC